MHRDSFPRKQLWNPTLVSFNFLCPLSLYVCDRRRSDGEREGTSYIRVFILSESICRNTATRNLDLEMTKTLF